MNDNRCPKCNLLNLPSAVSCLQCQTPLMPPSALPADFQQAETVQFQATQSVRGEIVTNEFSHSTSNYTQAERFSLPGSNIPPGNKTGSRTYFWYRLFCSAIVVFGIIWAIIGLLALIGSFDETGEKATNAFNGGIFLFITGAVPTFLCLLGVVFPPRSWSWYFGILVLVLATLSCGLALFSIPLFIFWIKPETQSFFGRK